MTRTRMSGVDRAFSVLNVSNACDMAVKMVKTTWLTDLLRICLCFHRINASFLIIVIRAQLFTNLPCSNIFCIDVSSFH